MDKRLFLFACLALSLSVHGISSEQAKSIAAQYLLKGEVVVVGPFNPIEFAGERYWLLYFSPQDQKDSKNLIVVVHDMGGTGVLETRETVLMDAYELDFHLDLMKLLNDRQASFDALDQVAQSVIVKIRSNARVGLDRITAQQASYPELEFEDLELALSDVEDYALLASDRLAEGASSQNAFTQSFFADDLILAHEQYAPSFNSLEQLAETADRYHQKLDEKQNEVSKAGLDREIASTLSTSLESVRDVGIDASFLSFLEPRRREFETRLARKDVQVNDSLTSFYFRKANVEAVQAYDQAMALSRSPDALLSDQYKTDFAACQVDRNSLKEKWLPIKQLMSASSVSAEEYSRVPLQIAESVALADSLADQLERCLQGSTPTPTPKPEESNPYGNVLLVIFLAVVAFLAFRFYQKRQTEQQEEEA
ncbi:hypothetical protein KJ765_06140 [Candidatus Micrarchaeota archaeon]|nr:hypothetical protein [Candidatus Micrarchaeota archaeon]